LLYFDDTIDVNGNKRGFIESVYRYASASDFRTADVNKKKRKKERKKIECEGDTIEETMKIVDRRENDRHKIFRDICYLFRDICYYLLTLTYRWKLMR